MLFRRLIKADEIEIEGHTYTVKYFESITLRGTKRYSAELVLGPADRIILDGSSLIDLESRVSRLAPATLHSRVLAAKGFAA